MKIFLLLFVLKTVLCLWPYPNITNKELYLFQLQHHEMYQIYFYKPTLLDNPTVFFYDNEIIKKRLVTWNSYYYIIDSGRLYNNTYGERISNITMLNVPFRNNLLLPAEETTRHVWVDPGVKLEFKVWITNQTRYKGDDHLQT